MKAWNWDSFITDGPGYGTFRLFGFGVLVYSTDCQMAEVFDSRVWGVPIIPGWRFAFVAPWL